MQQDCDQPIPGRAPADDRTGAVGFIIIQKLGCHRPMPAGATANVFFHRTSAGQAPVDLKKLVKSTGRRWDFKLKLQVYEAPADV